MKIDKTLIFTILILCIVTSIPSALFFRKKPATELLPSEKAFINFSSVPVAVFEPKQQPVFSGFDCPVKAAVRPPAIVKNLPPAIPFRAKPTPSPEKALPKVSMIYFEDGATNKAIIGGQILQVGSTFDSNTVLKIEQTRVQIRNLGKDIWLNMQ